VTAVVTAASGSSLHNSQRVAILH